MSKISNLRKRVARKILSTRLYLERSTRPRLGAVEIEICSACNRKCEYCPNHDNTREEAFLDEGVFRKIIDELAEMGFKGKVTYNLFNEPLLDKRLPKFIAYTRSKLPGAFIYLNTNGDFLNLKMWETLRGAGLDLANITQYDGKVNGNIRKILDMLPLKDRRHFSVKVFNENMVCNRGGSLNVGRRKKFPLRKFCHLPFYQMSVNYRGQVVLCCNDYFSRIQFGDLSKERVRDVWLNDRFVFYRKNLLKRDRGPLQLCKTCDF